MEDCKLFIEGETPIRSEISMLREDSYVCTEWKSPLKILPIDQNNNEIHFKCLNNKSNGKKNNIN